MSQSYKEAGVNLSVGNLAKADIKVLAAQTHTEGVLKGVGLFSGFFEMPAGKYSNPVLVSSVDGVGTKTKIADMTGQYVSIGHDLVNHCINDIAVCGADPLFFLDYLGSDKLNSRVVQELVKGMADACVSGRCALIGGETAEMPGVYVDGNIDVVGAIVGVVEKSKIIDGSAIGGGDVLLGVPSDGLHTNGYSLARNILFGHGVYTVADFLPELGGILGDVLLAPHKSYLPLIRKVREIDGLHGISHITGGGLIANTERLLSSELELDVEWSAWQRPPIFNLLQRVGSVEEEEMRVVFNLGIGLVLVVAREAADKIMAECKEIGEDVKPIGAVVCK